MTMCFFELFSFVVAAFEIQVGGRAGRLFSNSLKENDCTTCNLVDETTEALNYKYVSDLPLVCLTLYLYSFVPDPACA